MIEQLIWLAKISVLTICAAPPFTAAPHCRRFVIVPCVVNLFCAADVAAVNVGGAATPGGVARAS